MKSGQENGSTGSTASDSAQRSAGKQMSVLLVEDDRSVRRYLEVTLERSGYKVIAAEDGLAAMKHAVSSQIDVVVTDAIMPQLGGRELARFFRANPKLSSVPIVLLTGQENREAAATAENLIDAFLFKPVRAEELRKCVSRVLQAASPKQNQVKIN